MVVGWEVEGVVEVVEERENGVVGKGFEEREMAGLLGLRKREFEERVVG